MVYWSSTYIAARRRRIIHSSISETISGCQPIPSSTSLLFILSVHLIFSIFL
ncbi:hypothetical protein PGB90_006861 [Kerria lacca]